MPLTSNMDSLTVVSYVEDNGLYAEEQNEFRQSRSTSDHIFVVTSIIMFQKLQDKLIYAPFIDVKNALDRVDRE